MNTPLLSVISPVYNKGKYLEQTIASFRPGQESDVELIFVDDGSTDRSPEILRSLEKYPNVRILTQENKGAPAARNAGFEASSGRYIWFFDADDYVNEGSLRTVKAHLQNMKAQLLTADYTNVTHDGRFLEEVRYAGSRLAITRKDKLLYAYLAPPYPGNKIYVREVIDRHHIRFADVRLAQDLNFYLKYLAYVDRIEYVQESLTNYRVVDGSISHSYDERLLEIIRSLEEVDDFCAATLDEARKRYLKMAGYSHLIYQLSRLEQVADEQLRDRMREALTEKIRQTREPIRCIRPYERFKLAKLDAYYRDTVTTLR